MQLSNLLMLAGLSATAITSTVPVVERAAAPAYTCPYICPARPISTLKTFSFAGLLGVASPFTLDLNVYPPVPLQRLDGVCCLEATTAIDIATLTLELQLLGLGAGLNLSVASTQKNCIVQKNANFVCPTGSGKPFCCATYMTSNVLGFIGLDCTPSVLA